MGRRKGAAALKKKAPYGVPNVNEKVTVYDFGDAERVLTAPSQRNGAQKFVVCDGFRSRISVSFILKAPRTNCEFYASGTGPDDAEYTLDIVGARPSWAPEGKLYRSFKPSRLAQMLAEDCKWMHTHSTASSPPCLNLHMGHADTPTQPRTLSRTSKPTPAVMFGYNQERVHRGRPAVENCKASPKTLHRKFLRPDAIQEPLQWAQTETPTRALEALAWLTKNHSLSNINAAVSSLMPASSKLRYCIESGFLRLQELQAQEDESDEDELFSDDDEDNDEPLSEVQLLLSEKLARLGIRACLTKDQFAQLRQVLPDVPSGSTIMRRIKDLTNRVTERWETRAESKNRVNSFQVNNIEQVMFDLALAAIAKYAQEYPDEVLPQRLPVSFHVIVDDRQLRYGSFRAVSALVTMFQGCYCPAAMATCFVCSTRLQCAAVCIPTSTLPRSTRTSTSACSS